jgi:adenylate cyclase
MPAVKVNLPTERSVRLATGLIMFSYALCHFLSHATGVFLLDNMEAFGRGVLLVPWRTTPARCILLICFLTHGTLGLRALYRRRHLRMPALEALQLGLGLLIPLLLIPHVSNVRLGYTLYGLEDSFYRLVYSYWLTQPLTGLPRQFALLLAVWIHGCAGIHMWLRYRPWYRIWRGALLAAAILVPVASIVGINNAGWDAAWRARSDPDFRIAHGPPQPGAPAETDAAALVTLWQSLQLAYIALVGAVFIARVARDRRDRLRSGVAISYADGHVIRVPRGFSVLEASRWSQRPHASACGGRGRCSTCRVQVLRGADRLPKPAAQERSTLERVGAAAGVRLACQIRPDADITVAPLISAERQTTGLRVNLQESREMTITALYVDLRESTRLAAGRLPFDAIFIVNRYLQAVTTAVQQHGGYVTSVAGDGVMSVFGLNGKSTAAARSAILALSALWRAVDQASDDFAEELDTPLRFGAGVHTGLSIVGNVAVSGRNSIHFLGDTGNVAARLEAMTKEMACAAIISQATVDAIGMVPDWRRTEIDIRGREAERLSVFLVQTPEELESGHAAPTGEPRRTSS